MRRSADVRRPWRLWIYQCEWLLTLNDAQLADSEPDAITISRGLQVLNGQALTSVQVEPHDGRSRFSFDLGCALAASPYQAEVAQ